MRYTVIRREMTNITDAVLAATLRELLADGLIRRRQFDEIPPRVEYALTEKGRSVLPILQSVCRWAGQYYRDEGDGPTPPQCRRCDHRSGAV